jgi:hypothetical protein
MEKLDRPPPSSDLGDRSTNPENLLTQAVRE